MVDLAKQGALADYADRHTVADFICEFGPHGSPRLDTLLSGCPFIRGRTFAMSSSPRRRLGYVEMILWGNTGLCAIKIENGSYEYPKDKGTPMIIIAMGSGFGAMMGLLDFRKCVTGPFGLVVVICEFPKKAMVPQIDGMLQESVEAKLLDRVIWTFTEDEGAEWGGWKEALKGNMPLLWPLWMDDRATLFVLGPVGTGSRKDIIDILLRYTMEEGNLRHEEAMAWIERHSIVIDDYQRHH
jgi:sulfite reductase alpha subunit-like flavoprotein